MENAATVHSYDLAASLASTWFVDSDDGFPASWQCEPLIVHAAVALPFSASRDKAATRIQMACKRAIVDPRYMVCRRRLMREYDDLSVV